MNTNLPVDRQNIDDLPYYDEMVEYYEVKDTDALTDEMIDEYEEMIRERQLNM